MVGRKITNALKIDVSRTMHVLHHHAGCRQRRTVGALDLVHRVKHIVAWKVHEHVRLSARRFELQRWRQTACLQNINFDHYLRVGAMGRALTLGRPMDVPLPQGLSPVHGVLFV